MMKALVDPNGRIAQVEPVNVDPESGGIPFPVAKPLRWIDCPDGADPRTHYFDGRAVVSVPPPAPISHNDAIDQRIDEVYAAKPITPRGATEIAYAIALYRDLHEAQIDALVAVIRQIGGPSFSSFDVPRIPDLKKNKGMQEIKAIIDETAALRALKT